MKATKEFSKKKVSVIEVDEQQLRAHVSEVVRESVEETLIRNIPHRKSSMRETCYYLDFSNYYTLIK